MTRAEHIVELRETRQLHFGRTLAIDPRSRRVAWAYFQDGDLKDCRMKTFREDRLTARVENSITPFLSSLLDDVAPHALLVPKVSGGGTRARSRQVRRVLRSVAREAVRRGIAVHGLSAAEVKSVLRLPNGGLVKNRRDVDELVLDRFPELTTLVPEPRLHPWQPEEYFAPLFNTVAMYMAWMCRLAKEHGN